MINMYIMILRLHTGGKHVPNFVHTITHSGEEFAAEGTNCVELMIKHFRRPKYANYTFIAHNASGFDAHILLEYFTSVGLTPKIMMQGCRIIFMYDSVFKQCYIDSFSFLPMSLSKTTSAFGIDNGEKGFFPHHFNRPENVNYVGPYPSKLFYGYNTMNNLDRERFNEWYDSVQNKIFDFRNKLRLYCRNDVIILRQACMKFRDEFMSCAQIDPFKCLTLAGT